MPAPAVKVELGLNLGNRDPIAFKLDDAIRGVLDNTSYTLSGNRFFDISDRLIATSTARGKNQALDRIDAGTSSIVVDNSDRHFDPLYPDGPYFGQLIPRRSVRITCNGFPVFLGSIDDFDIVYAPSNRSQVRIDVSEEMLHLIPKTDDKYVVQKEECARIVAAIMDNEKILVTGPTGSGKSSLIKYVCSLLGAPFIRINMSADAESSVLFGQLVVREGATVWEDGPITEAVRYGGVVLIDEWELMPPEISMGLQNLLEDDGYLFLKEKPGSAADKTFVPHKNFRLICAGNTVGQGDESGGFSGTMVQNSATLDRFTTTVCLDYLSKPHEMSIIRGKTKVSKPTAENMIKLASLIRSAYNQQQINLTMSPRTLLSWGNKIVRHDGNVWFAFTIAFYDKLRDSDKKVVKELFDKVHAV